MAIIEQFEAMLASGTDNAMLRFGLGNAYYKAGDCNKAIEHLAQAVRHDPRYSAAWKMYGKALAECGRDTDAMEAYERGIRTAEDKGDIQAAKEMRVFQKRLSRQRQERG